MFIKKFNEITYEDLPQVGGKNAGLGEMFNNLGTAIRIPNGFAITAQAYWHFLEVNALRAPITAVLTSLTPNNLYEVSKQIRTLIEQGIVPQDLMREIQKAYATLEQLYYPHCDVAVRSSATAEDLPSASFAGQQETFLNVNSIEELLISYKKCLSSLFTPRAIMYRQENNFDHMQVALSVGVQKMVRSDLACSGVAFTIDTESGFNDVIYINSSWGLGEAIVQGNVTPDSFYVFKPTLRKGLNPLLKKEIGSKNIKMVYDTAGTIKEVGVDKQDQQKSTLTDHEIIELSAMCLAIEDYFSTKNNHHTPMDIEWAKDGIDNKLYIVQARPETIFANRTNNKSIIHYVLDKNQQLDILISGKSIGQHIVTGPVKIIKSAQEINNVQQGDIIVTTMTNPDWVPVMKIAAGIITNEGGRTCHAAIVSRELQIPAIVGTKNATEVLVNGTIVTLDCSQGETGYVYKGAVAFTKKEIEIHEKNTLPIQLYVNIADPNQAFNVAQLPSDGVGLARMEFIIANAIKIHPMALLQPEKITDAAIKEQINQITYNYQNKTDYFVDTLAQQAGTIAAAFYPRPVIIRFSDFKTNEYRNLLGGSFFEPQEENPMIGWRGASRYYDEQYKPAFVLECAAIKKMRTQMGLDNIQVMIPFVRTTQEAQVVRDIIKKELSDTHLKIIMMCEVPSNVLLIDEFAKIFDGFSIGSNDLTQLTLAVDRDSMQLAHLFNEQDLSVIKMITMAIKGAQQAGKPIGICGQGPSDNFAFAQQLIDLGITSISLTPDALIPFLHNIT